MKYIFTFQENNKYNLRSGIHLASRNMRTKLLVRVTVSNLGATAYNLGPYCQMN